MKWIGQHIYDLIARFRSDVYLDDIQTGTIASGCNLGLDSNNKVVKAAVSSGGSGDIESVRITTDSGSGAPALVESGDAQFTLLGASGVGVTNVDNAITVTAVPGEIVHDDLSGFLEAEHFTQANITTVGTIGTGVWQGTAIASAYLDADTAHLTTDQTFTGTKTFGKGLIVDGNTSISILGDGQAIHIDGSDITDATTSPSGTAAKFAHVNIEAPRLLASAVSVTTTNAATFYIDRAPVAGANQTIGSAWSLWVDAGNVRFDGSIYQGTTRIFDDSGVIQVATQGNIDHDSLTNFVANEHIDWTTDQGSTNIHTGNYINTTYSEATSSEEGLMSTDHHDKLDSIETHADVTDATNVTAAGALMDSECTDLASVKALNQGVATGDSPQFTGINLGHASDTTFARSAAGVATIESNIIQTKNKIIHLEQGTLSDNITTAEHFFPAVTTSESESFTNVVTPFLMPVAGKLLKIHLKANQNHNTSSNEVTFKLYDLDDGENWNDANKSLLGTKVISGTAKATVMVADFQDLTTTGASGTNAFQAGDLIGISLQNSQNLNITTKYVWSFVFELDFNSY